MKKNSKEEFINSLLNKTYNSVFIPNDISLSTEDLEKEYNGKTLLEIIINSNISTVLLFKNICVSPKLIKVVLESQDYTYMYSCKDMVPLDILFLDYDDKNKYIDVLLDKCSMIVTDFSDKRVIEYVIKNRNEYASFFSESALNKWINGLTDEELDEYFKDSISNFNILDKLMLGKTQNIRLINYYINNGCFSILEAVQDERILLQKFNNKLLIDIIIENNKDFKLSQLEDEELFDYLLKTNNLSIYNISPSKIDGPFKESTVLDYALRYNLKFSIDTIDREEFDLIKDNNRLDIYINSTAAFNDEIIELYDLNRTYLDVILEEYKNNINKYNHFVLNVNYLFCKDEVKAKIINIFAKHGLISHIAFLNKETILESNILSELLKIDSEFDIKNIIEDKLLNDIEVSTKLDLIGIKKEGAEIPSVDDYQAKYISNINSRYENVIVSSEAQQLLDEFKSLMNDGRSDEELINAVIISYKKTLSINEPLGISELKKLIEIKKRNHEFAYVKTKNGSSFSPSFRQVFLDTFNLNTIDHENGHAFHEFLSTSKIPECYDEIISKLQNNPDFIKKVSNYSKQFNDLKNKIIKVVEKECESFFDGYYTDDKIAEIEKFLSQVREKHKEDYNSEYNKQSSEKIKEKKELDINDILKYIDKNYTVEEYISQQKKIYTNEVVDVILRNKYGAFISLGDFFDAIYHGRLYSKELLTNNGNVIASTYGHGVRYYGTNNNEFTEMIANYAAILKSTNGKKCIEVMYKIFGSELMDLLSQFYNNELINSKEYEQSNKEVL